MTGVTPADDALVMQIKSKHVPCDCRIAWCRDCGKRWPCPTARLVARIQEGEQQIRAALDVGYNEDCMFCGFKDRALGAAPPPEGGRDD